MTKPKSTVFYYLFTFLFTILITTNLFSAINQLKRQVAPKPVYETLPSGANTNEIIFKLQEGMGQPEFDGQRFLLSGSQWDSLNEVISTVNKTNNVKPHIELDKNILNEMRLEGSQRTGRELPDLTLYYKLTIAENATAKEKLELVSNLNNLSIIEIAYFSPIPVLASKTDVAVTPSFESGQYYLQPAPTGINAYYGWNTPGGRGAGVKVVDIEGNWIETHEDLHGGTDNFHIAGGVINDPGWWNHGTAVLGEIAADSNNFGMTGIAFEVDLGTVSIGTMDLASALSIATSNSDTGDIILIELQYSGPNGGAYVPAEYYQDNFDAILLATSLDRIVVEAGANGAQNLDDPIYGSLFDPSYRFSGAIMVAASYNNHIPAPFTSHGKRLDVHAFGTWDVYTLGYGDLYGGGQNNYYTASFSGTSSASPIIVGSCAILQGIHKTTHGRILDHNEMRTLLKTYSTPQAAHSWEIGPLPDLQGSVDEVTGISFIADVTYGWVPLTVNFTASSGLQVDTWVWDFGDGDSAFVQSPSHIYQAAGRYDVTVQIDAGGDIREVTKNLYINALADTLIADTAIGDPGEQVEIVISANNTVPIDYIKIPVEYPGNLNLTYDSISTVGCRTDYFEIVELLHYDPFNRRLTIKLETSNQAKSSELPAGAGDIAKLYMTIYSGASSGQTASVILDGYDIYAPYYYGNTIDYQVETIAGEIAVTSCFLRGDIDNNGVIDIADLVYFVEYSFNDGPPPPSIDNADVDCSGEIDIGDIIYMVEFMFDDGPAPCGC